MALNVFNPLKYVLNEIISRASIFEEEDSSLSLKRFMRFLVAGGVNTIFGFIVYSLCIVNEFSVWLAVLIGTISGTIFNFFTTGGYVFRQLSLTRFPRFILCYIFVYGTNLMLIELISIFMTNKILTQAIITLPLSILSYFFMSRFVFDAK